MNDLHKALNRGSWEEVLTLIKQGADVHAADKSGFTPLHHVVTAHSELKFDVHIDDHAHANATDIDDNGGPTSPYDFTRKGVLNVASLRIGEASDSKAISRSNYTDLHDATSAGLKETLSRKNGLKEITDLLLEKGADIEAADKSGQTALHYAASLGSGATALLLLEKGANIEAVDELGYTALHHAAVTEKKKIIRLLLKKGANIEAVDSLGRSALHNAAALHKRKTIRLLLAKGADIKAADIYGRTVLHEAVILNVRGFAETVELLVENGADIKAVDKKGRTALHDAVRRGSERIIPLLLDKGADIKAADNDGRTALHHAVSANNARITCLLVHLCAENCDLDQYGLPTLRMSLHTPFGPPTNLLLAFPDSIIHCSTVDWDGLRVYEECVGDIGDVLTISKINPRGHSYIAMSVSEYLTKHHEPYGFHLLQWTTGVIETCIHARTAETYIEKYSHSIYHNGVLVVGILEDRKFTILISAEHEGLMLEVKSALIWILAVLQPRPENREGMLYLQLDLDFLENGIPEPIEFKPEKSDRYCWTELFSYCLIIGIPTVEATLDLTTDGLDIQFSHLVELAAVDRQTTKDYSFTMMYGFDSAIIPLEPARARRWHLMTTAGRQITPMRAKEELSRRNLKAILLSSEDLCGNVYVGWCPNPAVTICSSPGISSNDDIMRPSGVPAAKKVEVQSEWSLSTDFSFSPRVGFLGSSLGFLTGVKREKKFREVDHVTKRTAQDNFENVLTSAKSTPSILWDNSKKRAWLLPVISVLAFASLRFVESEKYSFETEQGESRVETAIYYSMEMAPNTRDEPATVLRRNSTLLVNKANGDPVSKPITFEQVARSIWEKMCDGEDQCVNKTTGLNFEDSQGILGYDLSEAMSNRTIQLRQLQYLPAMRSWKPLCQGQRLQIIFSQYVGEILSCNCNAVDGLEALQQLPDGTLTCLLNDLKWFYGASWNEPCSNGLPVGEEFEWIPRGDMDMNTYLRCGPEMLQAITKKQNKLKQNKLKQNKLKQNKLKQNKLKQNKLKRNREFKGTDGGSRPYLPRDQRLIHFG